MGKKLCIMKDILKELLKREYTSQIVEETFQGYSYESVSLLLRRSCISEVINSFAPWDCTPQYMDYWNDLYWNERD